LLLVHEGLILGWPVPVLFRFSHEVLRTLAELVQNRRLYIEAPCTGQLIFTPLHNVCGERCKLIFAARRQVHPDGKKMARVLQKLRQAGCLSGSDFPGGARRESPSTLQSERMMPPAYTIRVRG
jgi:hypothetical protein